MTIKQIENTWKKNFKKSPLVKNGVFNSSIARSLFHGSNDKNELPFKRGFKAFHDNCEYHDKENVIDELLEFLHYIGITISKYSILEGISNGSPSFQNVLKKAFYIFKHLASYDENLDINDPYHDNLGDLTFFLRIEEGNTGEAKQLTFFDELELPEFYNKYIELPKGYENDKTAQNIFNLIENSNKSFFLTGKAGTGKSTFIQFFTKKTEKNVLLVAFTGIAAINIGGQTIHSFFRLPLKPLLPNDPEITVFKSFVQKRKILEQTDTIIIDEVSMLRSDILEGLDYSLRMNGGDPNVVFGGKQIIFVGDIFQLPPVVDNSDSIENELFKLIYDSEYFFDSIAYKKLNPEIIEFSKIHRQTNEKFISLLNKVRNCSIDKSGIDELNKRFNPIFTPKHDEFVITLTTNNFLSKNENTVKLNSLPYKSHFFKANIIGDFKEDKYPTDVLLELKRNSQIILVKNDSIEKGRRWVNGTIAKIEFLDNDKIELKLKDGTVHKLEKETWENRQYQWDKNKGQITSKVIGTFEQYPIKLAWAITIHKSQGLTFDNVIIDLGSGAFVNGQLYTALSRCRTLEGLTLKRKISEKDIITDSRLMNFYQKQILKKEDNSAAEKILENISANDFFIMRLISTHHPFSKNEILKYSSIIKWGSGVNTEVECDTYYQEASFAKYGLSFNNNIKWTDDILANHKFENNSYQWTGFDENLIPLPKNIEINNRIEIIRQYEDLQISENPYYGGPNCVYSDDDIDNMAAHNIKIQEESKEAINELQHSLERSFEFKNLNDFFDFTNSCKSIYCLNKNLYENFLSILKKNQNTSINSILGIFFLRFYTLQRSDF